VALLCTCTIPPCVVVGVGDVPADSVKNRYNRSSDNGVRRLLPHCLRQPSQYPWSGSHARIGHAGRESGCRANPRARARAGAVTDG